ncbi:hypothetical protein OROHE_006773 [Orobanche hederae]
MSADSHCRLGNTGLLSLLSNNRNFSGMITNSVPRRRSSYCCSGAASAALTEIPVRIVAIVGQGSVSPLKSTPWYDVMFHTAEKLKWVDEGFEMVVFSDNVWQSNDKTIVHLQKALTQADILAIISVTNQESIEWIQTNSQDISNILCFDSAPTLTNKLGGSPVQTKPVETLAKGFSTLNCMVRNCGPQILNCLLDENCRKALQCLNKCSPMDQVCNYQCIASYESPQLEEFSLCVLQKNNCLELDARIPEMPVVGPMVQFRGEALDHETAEDLFVGWLGSLDWSWRPVFQVRTVDGELVWRRRKYRVKRGKTPGTFYFSLLDNGVVSNEFWTIVDVADDLGWGLFHYNGATRVAGQLYTGAVLASPNGLYPDETKGPRLEAALGRCGIKEWEMFDVDNCSCENPPLGLPEGSSLHCKIKVGDLEDSSVSV